MKIPKVIDRLLKRAVWPIKCSCCGGLLYKDSERKAGISKKCANKIARHKANQIDETHKGPFFYTLPGNPKPSPFFLTLEEIIKLTATLRSFNNDPYDYKIWEGSYENPILVRDGGHK